MKMSNLTPDEEAARKKAIFDNMSPRGQKFILKRGYDQWDPFQEPKDPIDIRTDKTKRTSQMLVREFLQACSHEDYTTDYGRGVFEICMGIINNDEASRGMFEFSCWYQDLLRKEGYLADKDEK
ncbi:MAG: hypothetical protein GY697_08345 [Desulfobacterales bacterium]|nr:hypothetical protein [Desulfobacterales bacterium]